MAIQTAQWSQIGADTATVSYDTVSGFATAITLTGPDTVFVSVTDTVTGGTASGTFAPGTYALPANKIAWPSVLGRLVFAFRAPA